MFLATLTTSCIASGDLVTQRLFEDAHSRQERRAGPTSTGTPTPTPPSPTFVPTQTPLPGRTFARVIRVWDGNTVEVEGATRPALVAETISMQFD